MLIVARLKDEIESQGYQEFFSNKIRDKKNENEVKTSTLMFRNRQYLVRFFEVG